MAKKSYIQSAAKALYETTFALSEQEAGDVVKRFVALLKSKKRLDLAPQILIAYERLATKRADTVTLTCAEELSAASAEAVRQTLGEAIALELKTDPKLIAGAVIRHGDTLRDASVKRKLELLKQTMTA